MKCYTCCVLLILSVVLCVQSRVGNVDNFKIKVRNTTHSIILFWDWPDKRISQRCYRTHLQYRSHCETSWKNYTDISGFSFELPAPDLKKNYAFRLRMKIECTRNYWGKWSPVIYWKNDAAPCITEKSMFTVKGYLLILMLPLVGFVLVCAITNERVRRHFLPIIPDPKNTQKRILNIEQMQWWSNFAQTCDDCKVSEIKIYDREEEQMESILINSDLDEQPTHTHPTLTVPGKHDFDTAMKNSMNLIYTFGTSKDNIGAQCPATRPDYIII